MKKFLIVVLIIVILIVVGLIFLWKNLEKGKGQNFLTEVSMEKSLLGKKIAIIIAFRDFRDEEYFIPKQILEAAGAQVITISVSTGTAIGVGGGEAEIDILVKDLKISDYSAVLFIGGPGAQKYFDDLDFHRVAKETVESNKTLGAICIAPAILAKAGVLQRKKATVWNSVMDKSAIKILESGGAIFQSDPVVVDGKIITANGPDAVQEFAQKIIESLK